MKLMKRLAAILLSIGLVGLGVLNYAQPVRAVVSMYDEFFYVGNNTNPQGEPSTSVNAAPGNIVEFFIRVRNTGDEDAKRVQVWAALPPESSTKFTVAAYIRPNNPDRVNVQISDSVVVNVTGGQPVGIRFLPGHTRFAGVTNKFNCPNVCDINNEDILKGIEVGDVPAGQEVQLAFKAFLTHAATPQPSPTPSPSVSPSPTPQPTASPSPSPTVTSTPTPTVSPLPSASPTNMQLQCPAGFVAHIQGSNIICLQQQQSQSQSISNVGNPVINISVASGAAQPTVVGQVKGDAAVLPKTGLPLAGLALAGFLPLGWKLKRFAVSDKEDVETRPIDLWIHRQLSRD